MGRKEVGRRMHCLIRGRSTEFWEEYDSWVRFSEGVKDAYPA